MRHANRRVEFPLDPICQPGCQQRVAAKAKRIVGHADFVRLEHPPRSLPAHLPWQSAALSGSLPVQGRSHRSPAMLCDQLATRLFIQPPSPRSPTCELSAWQSDRLMKRLNPSYLIGEHDSNAYRDRGSPSIDLVPPGIFPESTLNRKAKLSGRIHMTFSRHARNWSATNGTCSSM